MPSSEIVLLESTNPDIKVAPDSATVDVYSIRDRMNLAVTLTSDVKGASGWIEATTLDKQGNAQKARVEVKGVDDTPVLRVPQTMDFTSPVYSGTPNRENKATLLVNLRVHRHARDHFLPRRCRWKCVA